MFYFDIKPVNVSAKMLKIKMNKRQVGAEPILKATLNYNVGVLTKIQDLKKVENNNELHESISIKYNDQLRQKKI